MKKGSWRYPVCLALLAVIFFLFTGCPCGDRGEDADESPSIDPALETALLEKLDKSGGALTEEDWSGLERVRFLGRSIEDLNGFQQAANLQELNLRRNGITDLTPLGDLPHLEVLILADNRIKDISGLNGPVLSKLKHLDLSINEIEDLTLLDWDRLESLVHLDLRYNYINLNEQVVADLLKELRERHVEVLADPMY